jgi:uncharacterized protein
VKLDTICVEVLNLPVWEAKCLDGKCGGMHINVSQLMKEPSGARRSVEVDESVSLESDVERIRVRGTVGLMRTDLGVWVSASLRSEIRCVCSRCLDELAQPIGIDIEEEFLPVDEPATGSSGGVEGNLSIDDHHILDLADAIREYATLNTPMKPMCSSECLGICLRCGVNLNDVSCVCGEAQRDSRWDALLELTSADDSRS